MPFGNPCAFWCLAVTLIAIGTFWFNNFFRGNSIAMIDYNGTLPEILFLAFNIPGYCSFRVAEPEGIISVGILKSCCITAAIFSTSFFSSSSSCWRTHLLSYNSYASSLSSSGPQSLKSLSVIRLHCVKACATVTAPKSYVIMPVNNSASSSQLHSGLYCRKRKSGYTYRYILECFLLL